MNNQNFYLRLIALLLIIMAVFFYNGTVKDKEQAQDIADLTAKTESLENQQDQILTALKETYEEQKTAAESNASSDVSSEADNNPKKIPQRIKKIQSRQILKKLMILTMYIKMALRRFRNRIRWNHHSPGNTGRRYYYSSQCSQCAG